MGVDSNGCIASCAAGSHRSCTPESRNRFKNQHLLGTDSLNHLFCSEDLPLSCDAVDSEFVSCLETRVCVLDAWQMCIEQLVELSACYISPFPVRTCPYFLPTRCARHTPVNTHGHLKNRPGRRGLRLPYYILARPMWGHPFLVTLEAERERLILLLRRCGRHTSPAAVVPWPSEILSVLRELFSGPTSPCLRSKCQVSGAARRTFSNRGEGNRNAGVPNVPLSSELFHKSSFGPSRSSNGSTIVGSNRRCTEIVRSHINGQIPRAKLLPWHYFYGFRFQKLFWMWTFFLFFFNGVAVVANYRPRPLFGGAYGHVNGKRLSNSEKPKQKQCEQLRDLRAHLSQSDGCGGPVAIGGERTLDSSHPGKQRGEFPYKVEYSSMTVYLVWNVLGGGLDLCDVSLAGWWRTWGSSRVAAGREWWSWCNNEIASLHAPP